MAQATMFDGAAGINQIANPDVKNKNYNSYKFLAISPVGEKAGGSLTASVPATGIKITQNVDYNVTKALDKNFLIATFGDRPTSITISGINIFSDCNMSNPQILEFYDNNKISTDSTKRVDLSIAGKSGKATTFRCAQIGQEVTGEDEQVYAGFYKYTLFFVGVRS